MKKVDERRTKVEAYEGHNEIINRIMGDSKVWIVTGVLGRRLLIADTAEEAMADYNSRENKWQN